MNDGVPGPKAVTAVSNFSNEWAGFIRFLILGLVAWAGSQLWTIDGRLGILAARVENMASIADRVTKLEERFDARIHTTNTNLHGMQNAISGILEHNKAIDIRLGVHRGELDYLLQVERQARDRWERQRVIDAERDRRERDQQQQPPPMRQ
jgi:hypothetical protein